MASRVLCLCVAFQIPLVCLIQYSVHKTATVTTSNNNLIQKIDYE